MNPYKSKSRSSKGFTLIEILTVIAIIAILSAILVPTVSQMQSTARKTKDLSNMRQIINASKAFGAQNGDLMVQAGHDVDATIGLTYDAAVVDAPSIGHVAAVLAEAADLNDLNIWISDSDKQAMKLKGPTPALVAGVMNPALADTTPVSDTDDPSKPITSGYLSFHYVVGLSMSAPNQTPLIFSRLGTSTAPKWGTNDMYKGNGGHIGFTGGNVSWFEGDTPFANLFDGEGTSVTTMSAALDPTKMPAGNDPDIAEN
ncbi:MAG: prepilin-type N-terminal cleavage/methylation domain-containing protein [Opitutaceae bacterium]|nr:prepilin-type N-terminal cleavage/methylation domain-containing protein [Opitutaceae bacterium]